MKWFERCVFQKAPGSTENFDSSFLKLAIKMTPPDWVVLENVKGDEFHDFSFVNPYYFPLVEWVSCSLLCLSHRLFPIAKDYHFYIISNKNCQKKKRVIPSAQISRTFVLFLCWCRFIADFLQYLPLVALIWCCFIPVTYVCIHKNQHSPTSVYLMCLIFITTYFLYVRGAIQSVFFLIWWWMKSFFQ